ncbi:uncharacterized protein LAESUDRAFT_668330 [Laetiporus sulphureus 93-53]|uniref:Uncharacterized protein n=1 Tax=Laetiporus sulphureus 93-53 TaxID=1314785 RepID=A0A165I3W7_9APHY|nr:uncharacterized protein LAESUDRAFT_668330 [Laetiporus sulphureus 93-53]KZT12562.1 hypothetical protein LAESUDRAFT_668330 [Laetiporus sulphureus 93-53]
MSSELSNALNPNVVPTRRHRPAYVRSPQSVATPVIEVQHRPYARSELELAVLEPPPRPPQPPDQQSCASVSRPVNPLHEILRVLHANRDAIELEHKRRRAWEQEQEERIVQQQAEMEKQMWEMRQELSLLKASFSLHAASAQSPEQGLQSADARLGRIAGPDVPGIPAFPTNVRSPQVRRLPGAAEFVRDPLPAPRTPVMENRTTPLPVSPLTPLSSCNNSPALNSSSPQLQIAHQYHTPRPPEIDLRAPSYSSSISSPAEPNYLLQRPGDYRSRTYIEGPSSQPLTPQITIHNVLQIPDDIRHSPLQLLTPATPVSQPSEPTVEERSIMPSHHKRAISALGGNGNEDCDGEDSDSSRAHADRRSRKRTNGHDGRCLTIHHAMRTHLLRMMKLDNDKELPSSHKESQRLGPEEPVRFVWSKTPKQSSHNAEMKKWVIADLKANRNLYELVPEKDFTKKNLDSVFDQAFTTLRQKFKAQQDSAAASHLKQRENQKAKKSRRLGRKKLKLANRIEAREKLAIFSHQTFDSALQQECMSSEESDEEDDIDPATGQVCGKGQVLQIRGLPWRSLRLQRFYATLDAEDQAGKSTKPKRGSGRRERRIGPWKDGVVTPPVGIAQWMVSKRWIRLLGLTRPDLADAARVSLTNYSHFDWSQCVVLGAESEDELELQEILPRDQYIPISETSYSLQNALNPLS